MPDSGTWRNLLEAGLYKHGQGLESTRFWDCPETEKDSLKGQALCSIAAFLQNAIEKRQFHGPELAGLAKVLAPFSRAPAIYHRRYLSTCGSFPV